MYRKNLLRQKLQAGEKLIGTWHEIPDPVVTEILSLSGLDFVLVDNEHGPGDVLTVANQLRAANGTDTTLVVRIPWNDHVMIKKLLDIGVESIMVPMVENAEEAEAVVSAVRYPPRGIRGIAHTDARASEYGFKADEYLETASDNTFVICQVESAKAANNIDEIVAVDGLDMIFIGPFDLSASLGTPAKFENPEHQRLMKKTVDATKAAGKYLGVTPYGTNSMADLYSQGFDLVVSLADVGMIRDAAKALAAKKPSK